MASLPAGVCCCWYARLAVAAFARFTAAASGRHLEEEPTAGAALGCLSLRPFGRPRPEPPGVLSDTSSRLELGEGDLLRLV